MNDLVNFLGTIPDFADYDSVINVNETFTTLNEVSLKNNWFSLKKSDGTVIDGGNQALDVYIVGVNPAWAKSYFAGAFGDEESKLICKSTNGIAPDKWVDPVIAKEHGCGPTCATCPRNIKGTKTCADRQYIAVIPHLDSSEVYQMNLSVTAKIALKDYILSITQQAKQANRKLPIEFVKTQLYFNPRDPKTGEMYKQPRLSFRAVGIETNQDTIRAIANIARSEDTLKCTKLDIQSQEQCQTAEEAMTKWATQAEFNAPGAYTVTPADKIKAKLAEFAV